MNHLPPPYINLDDLVDGCGSSDDDATPDTPHTGTNDKPATVATPNSTTNSKPLTGIHHRKRPVTKKTKHTYISIEGFGSANPKYRFKAQYGGRCDRRFPSLTDALVYKFCYTIKNRRLKKSSGRPKLGLPKLDTRGELRQIRKEMGALKAQNEELLKIVKHIRYILEE
tara:strand:- start:807 stop:1313 length:507 start_codon:yes stop_codon:yes gene_type:complete